MALLNTSQATESKRYLPINLQLAEIKLKLYAPHK